MVQGRTLCRRDLDNSLICGCLNWDRSSYCGTELRQEPAAIEKDRHTGDELDLLCSGIKDNVHLYKDGDKPFLV